MIRALIIDDEPLAIAIIKDFLKDYKDIIVIQECSNGFEGLKAITQHTPDLIFLDIQMPKINGFEMLELIETPPAVIFTTAFDQYAIRAFETHAIDYLLKPFSKERFDKAIHKWMEHQHLNEEAPPSDKLLETAIYKDEEATRIVVKSGNNIHIIPVADIHYLEAYDDYVKIHTDAGVFLKKKTMQYFENTLNPTQFVRVHRSFIVQLQQITRIEPMGKDSYIALLKDASKIPLSKSGYGKLKEALIL